jgi:hypothetical protein
MFEFTAENLAMISTAGGIVSSICFFLWKKLVKPAINLMDDHQEIKKSIDIIKNEVTPNGGGSMKDALNCLRTTCSNIEISQKVLDQRSKASLHYHDRALFEVDKLGRISWFNEKFELIAEDCDSPREGFDWVNIVDESEREEFVKELTSCLEMCRKIDIVTSSISDHKIHFLGYPYRITDREHEGFLINIYKEN